METLDRIGKNLPIGTLLIVFLSSIKLVVYYKIFNISIVDFIGIQEIITSFIDDLLYYCIVFGITIFLNFTEFTSNQESKIDFSVYKKERNIVLSLMAFILIGVLYMFFFDGDSLYQKVAFLGISSYILILLIMFLMRFTIYITPYWIFMTISIISYTTIFAYIEAYKIIGNENNEEYQILFKDNKIETNDNIKFLGNTEKYIFIYNISKDKTSIIDNSEIMEINVFKSQKN